MLDYGARWYDPYLNRFISPDTIVPDPANSQSFNRFAYVYNNPLKYTDPSGHRACLERDENGQCLVWEKPVVSSPLVHFVGDWGSEQRAIVIQGAETVAAELHDVVQADRRRAMRIAKVEGGDPSEYSDIAHLWSLSQDEVFLAVYGGPVTFKRSNDRPTYRDQNGNEKEYWAEVETNPNTGRPTVLVHDSVFDPGSTFSFHNPMHELGHAFAHRTGDATGDPRVPYDDLGSAGFGVYNPPWPWNQNSSNTNSENFADMFASWCGGNTADLGVNRDTWMTNHASRWIALAVR